MIGKERLYITLFILWFTPLSLEQVSRIESIKFMKMNYFHCLTLASLAVTAVSSREVPVLSSSLKTKGKRGLFDPSTAGSSYNPETLYRHQLDGYKTQDIYSRGQGQLYQRSVPHASQQQNQVGPPQTFRQPEGLSKYHSSGPPPSHLQKYYPSVKLQGYNQANIGKPVADGYQQKSPYAKSPYYSQPEASPQSSYNSYNPYSGQPSPKYQIQYQSQDALPKNHQPQYEKPEQQSYLSKYPEIVQKQIQEAINFQKQRLNQASFGSYQPQYQQQTPAATEQHQYSAGAAQQYAEPSAQQHQYSARAAQQYAEPSAQQYQYSARAAQQYAEPSAHQQEQYSQDQYQQQSEQVPESADQFYNQYLQIVNKQGFIQAPTEGDSYQQQYQQNYEGQDAQESLARPTRYLASGQLLNYKNSDLQGV